MSMPSLDIFKSTPPSEVLRVESEPPGADARTSQGQSCRTPCELTVQSGSEMSVSFSLNGHQPQTVQVRPEVAPTSYSDSGTGGKLQPNPVYAELQPIKPPAKKKSAPRKQTAQKAAPATAATTTTAPATTGGLQSSYPWPEPR
jgi:hypothetical protein